MLTVIIILLIVSFIWALWSLRGFKKDRKLIKGVKKELARKRVIFQK